MSDISVEPAEILENASKVMRKSEFIHFRVVYTDDEGNEQISPRGGVTVCYFLEDSAYFGVAVCSMLDNYCKRRGAHISLGRAEGKFFDDNSDDAYPLMTREEMILTAKLVAFCAWKRVCERQAPRDDVHHMMNSLKLVPRKNK